MRIGHKGHRGDGGELNRSRARAKLPLNRIRAAMEQLRRNHALPVPHHVFLSRRRSFAGVAGQSAGREGKRDLSAVENYARGRCAKLMVNGRMVEAVSS